METVGLFLSLKKFKKIKNFHSKIYIALCCIKIDLQKYYLPYFTKSKTKAKKNTFHNLFMKDDFWVKLDSGSDMSSGYLHLPNFIFLFFCY